jgi:hypothetical protein
MCFLQAASELSKSGRAYLVNRAAAPRQYHTPAQAVILTGFTVYTGGGECAMLTREQLKSVTPQMC